MATGETKPMASRTRSAGISNSESSISRIFIWPVASSLNHSTRTPTSFSTWPSLPANALVATDQSRSQPSSCEDEVRSLSGQYGQTMGLSSHSGGWGSSSNCVTEAAPWRLLVPTQSDPVSPPPITTTCLSLASVWPLRRSPATALFCWRRKSMA
ncbi:Uncharacterised protein [Bordetella pertussis]|nr:Uncharacterised protein [Bordetella pertussis]